MTFGAKRRDSLGAADSLPPEGRSDDDVERLIGVTLHEILSLRATLAASPSSPFSRDRFSGRLLWR